MMTNKIVACLKDLDPIAGHVGLIFGIVGILLTIIGIWLTILSSRQLEKLRKQNNVLIQRNKELEAKLESLQKISDAIADNSRRPLEGIEVILWECSELLEKIDPRKPFWFVGMSLCIGPPHKYRVEVLNGERLNIDRLVKNRCKVDLNFDQLCKKIIDSLKPVVGGSDSNTIVCLDENQILPKFIKKLSAIPMNGEMAKQNNEEAIMREIKRVHEEIAARAPKDRRVVYLGSIPFQVIIGQLRDEPRKRACIVFLVGTENASFNGQYGFYSESDNMCNMFANVVESLYESATVG